MKDDYASKSRLAKAYEVALDIRKFEIELYWKRSNSFWLVIAALGALLIGTVSAKDVDGNLKSLVTFAICSFASVVAYAWSLVNRAGKFWQRTGNIRLMCSKTL
ncbi:RipA family octameric membrane protein [Paraburkholderia strydomiana]|uniref:RipA family octameric membrane protein n=1 Tax=Paraburkholderia strydomiana TaxID=1245417 RepID=UPI0038B9E6E0